MVPASLTEPFVDKRYKRHNAHVNDENKCMGMYTASAEPCLSSLIVLLIGLCICNLNVKKGIFQCKKTECVLTHRY